MAHTFAAEKPPNDSMGDREPLSWASITILAYVVVWIMEGVLRKWMLPNFGNYLYYSKDLILVIGFMADRLQGERRRLPGLPLVHGTIALILLLASLQAMTGTTPIGVLLAGVQQFVSPLVFLSISLRQSTTRDVRLVSVVIVGFLPLEFLLTVAQVLSPARSFINQVGAENYGAMISHAGVVRASGTFTSNYGFVSYVLLSLAILLATEDTTTDGSSEGKKTARILQIISCLGIIALSGSRSLVFLGVALWLAYLIHGFTIGRTAKRALYASLLVGVAIAAATMFAPAVSQAFVARLADAERSQGTKDRIVQQAFLYTEHLEDLTALGEGLGSRSQSGIAMGSPRPWIEDEGWRWLTESGLVGLILAVVKQLSAGPLLVSAWQRQKSDTNPVTFFAACALAPSLIGGQVASQPSIQGFFAISLALSLLPQGVHR